MIPDNVPVDQVLAEHPEILQMMQNDVNNQPVTVVDQYLLAQSQSMISMGEAVDEFEQYPSKETAAALMGHIDTIEQLAQQARDQQLPASIIILADAIRAELPRMRELIQPYV